MSCYRPVQRVQHGFAAVTAIFLIVVLAALGGFMLTFSNTQQLTAVQDRQGSRAYWAARAGLEWGIGTVGTLSYSAAVCPTSPLSSSTELTVDTFQVVISCNLSTYNENGNDKKIFTFLSVASSPDSAVGQIGYVERSLSASIERPWQGDPAY